MPTQIDFELFAELARSDNPVEHAQEILGVSREHALRTVADWLKWMYEQRRHDLMTDYQQRMDDLELHYARQKAKYLS